MSSPSRAKWIPAQLGAEPKKVALLGGLVVIAIVAYWMSRTPSPDPSANVAPPTGLDPQALKSLPNRNDVNPVLTRDTSPMPPKRTASNGSPRSVDEFRPSLKLKEGYDVSGIDPTLHLDLLAKVQQVPMAGGSRSLFEFSQPPAPPPPPVAPIKVPPPAPAPPPPPPTAAAPPVDTKPPMPPIPLKYYGNAGTNRDGTKRAFFLDGDAANGEIFIASEGQTVKNRYKIVRIGVNSVVVEDTVVKNEQPLPLVEEAN